jgi:hypothetical protein
LVTSRFPYSARHNRKIMVRPEHGDKQESDARLTWKGVQDAGDSRTCPISSGLGFKPGLSCNKAFTGTLYRRAIVVGGLAGLNFMFSPEARRIRGQARGLRAKSTAAR